MPQLSPRLVFGPFEVNVPAGELRKHGVRLRLAPQPFEILLSLLEHPGEVVTRDELRQRIWAEGTFVDFDRGLNSAMAKLRRALGDSGETPRYIETVPARGYRFIGSLDAQSGSIGPAASAPPPPKPRLWHWWWLAPAAACLLIAFPLVLRLYDSTRERPPWKFTQLTTGIGFAGSPALSPDGKLLAYSSEEGTAGGRDLYIRYVGGGEPIRLTFDGADNTSPDFSPAGNRLVFRSSREGGGIYQIPTFGGDIRLVTRNGRNPKFSPDGLTVAYWTGAESVAAAIPGSGAVWVVPAGGGEPRRVGSKLSSARSPIWSPDGKHLLVAGYNSAEAFDSAGIDWWLVSATDGDAIRLGVYQAMGRAGLQQQYNRTPVPAIPLPSCWLEKSNAVIFSSLNGDAQNIWQIVISPATGRVEIGPERLTTGSGNEVFPSCSSNGSLAFANIETKNDAWVLPFDLNAGKPTGPLARIAGSPRGRETLSLSRNGRHLAFASYQSGRQSVWLRELETGKELGVAESPFAQRFPVANASGTRIAFSVYEKDKRVVYASSPGGAPERLCEGCLRATDWSLDEQKLLVFVGDPYQIRILDIASRKQTPVVSHPHYPVLYGKFSPDNRWVSFTARVGPGHGRIAIAPIDRTKPVAESGWIAIAEAGSDDYANWSPDGGTLYFTSGRDGYSCLWAQRIDAESHRPLGEAFAIQHFHGTLRFQHGGWSAAGGRIAIPLLERRGDIWMMSRSGWSGDLVR